MLRGIVSVRQVTEEAFEVGHLTRSSHKLRLVADAVESDVLVDQSHAIILSCWHDFLAVLGEEKFYLHPQVTLNIRVCLVGVEGKSVLLLDLTMVYFADLNERCGVDMVRKKDLSTAFSQSRCFACLGLNLKDGRLARFSVDTR